MGTPGPRCRLPARPATGKLMPNWLPFLFVTRLTLVPQIPETRVQTPVGLSRLPTIPGLTPQLPQAEREEGEPAGVTHPRQGRRAACAHKVRCRARPALRPARPGPTGLSPSRS